MVTIVRVPTRLSLRTARILSVIGPVGLVLSLVAGAMLLGADGRVQPLFHLLRLLFMVVSLVLFIDGRSQPTNVPEKFDRLFDERERAERDRAFRNSHKIVIACIIALCVYATIALGWGWWLPSVRGAIDIALGLAIIAMGLPGMILVWRDRSIPEED